MNFFITLFVLIVSSQIFAKNVVNLPEMCCTKDECWPCVDQTDSSQETEGDREAKRMNAFDKSDTAEESHDGYTDGKSKKYSKKRVRRIIRKAKKKFQKQNRLLLRAGVSKTGTTVRTMGDCCMEAVARYKSDYGLIYLRDFNTGLTSSVEITINGTFMVGMGTSWGD